MDFAEAVLEEIRQLRAEIGRAAMLPLVLTREMAARELSISLTTLKSLVREGRILTVEIGKRQMVPASELRRLAATDSKPKPEARTRSGLQDPEALRHRRC